MFSLIGRYGKYIIVAALALFVIVSCIRSAPTEHPAEVQFLSDGEFLPSILSDISKSETSINCALYMFKTDGAPTDATSLILGAIIDAKSRGIDVNIILDISLDDEYGTTINKATGDTLTLAGVNVYYDSPERRLHAKLCVIDSAITYTGSHNMTYSAMARNGETSVRVDSPEVAAEALEYIRGLMM